MASGLCLTLTAPDMATLLAARDAAADVDLLELRLDGVDRPDVRAALSNRRLPALVTCRAAWEGGRFDGSEEERERLLVEALEAGAEFVDVEWDAHFRGRLLQRAADRVVVSSHHFDGVPDDLVDRARAMRASGAAVVKLAVATRRLADVLPLLAIGRLFGRDHRLSLVGMGMAGAVSRILAARFGSCWTYAGAIEQVGQLPPGRLLREFRFRSIGAHTPVYGVLAAEVGRSVWPAMHNAAFDQSSTDAVCVPFDATGFEEFMRVAPELGVSGAAVSGPFSRDAFRVASSLDPDARRAGTVNTLKWDAERGWLACNTELEGFLAPLADERLIGARVAVLGAGAAARVAVTALASRGARSVVYARDPRRAAEIAALVDAEARPFPPAPDSWDVLVNATPVGAWPAVHDTPLPDDRVRGPLVYDLVYDPETTRLARAAAANGCRTVAGLQMLVAKAARQFTWWTGRPAPIEVMAEAARARLAARRAETGTLGAAALSVAGQSS